MRSGFICLALGALLASSVVQGLSKRELFPYGPQAGDQQLPPNKEDVSSQEISLNTHIKFFGREYGSIYVSSSGPVYRSSKVA